MDLVNEALRAPGSAAARSKPQGPTAVLVGGGGALGSAVLEQLLGRGRFARVRVLVNRGFKGAMQGLEPVLAPASASASAFGDLQPPAHALASLALVVFDRARHANGREDAFVRADPQGLPALARWLRAQRVRQLVVVLPHSPAGLPEALKKGLANLDEQAVAAMGFDAVVFVRTAQPPSALAGRPWPQRVADGLLQQLAIMLPASQQPVRVQKVAQFVAELARRLPASAHGARVVPPELMWQAAQRDDPSALLDDWLAGHALPPLNAPRMRL